MDSNNDHITMLAMPKISTITFTKCDYAQIKLSFTMVTIYNPKTTNYKTTRLVSKATTSASISVSEVEDREQEEHITEAKNGAKGPTGTVDVPKPAVKSDLTR